MIVMELYGDWDKFRQFGEGFNLRMFSAVRLALHETALFTAERIRESIAKSKSSWKNSPLTIELKGHSHPLRDDDWLIDSVAFLVAAKHGLAYAGVRPGNKRKANYAKLVHDGYTFQWTRGMVYKLGYELGFLPHHNNFTKVARLIGALTAAGFNDLKLMSGGGMDDRGKAVVVKPRPYIRDVWSSMSWFYEAMHIFVRVLTERLFGKNAKVSVGG